MVFAIHGRARSVGFALQVIESRVDDGGIVVSQQVR